MGRPFVDLDRAVEGRAGRTIRALFEEAGEDAFRELEAEVLREALELLPGAVIATGGGVVLRASNREVLARARVVYLHASPEVLAARVEADAATADDRPALVEGGPLAEAQALFAIRDPLYREVAGEVVEVDTSVDAVVEAVVDE